VPGHALLERNSGGPRELTGETEKAIRDALEARQHGIRKIAATLGVGTGTVQRVKASLSI